MKRPNLQHCNKITDIIDLIIVTTACTIAGLIPIFIIIGIIYCVILL